MQRTIGERRSWKDRNCEMRNWSSKRENGQESELSSLNPYLNFFRFRDRERRIIEIEKEELEKRENEVRRRSSDLDELRRGHRAVEDKLEGQIKELKMQLEDKRLAHNSEEQEVEYELRGQKEKMNELRRSLNRRIEEFGELDLLSPSSTSFSTGSSSNHPPAQIYLTSPASASSLCSQVVILSSPSLPLSFNGMCNSTKCDLQRQHRHFKLSPTKSILRAFGLINTFQIFTLLDILFVKVHLV